MDHYYINLEENWLIHVHISLLAPNAKTNLRIKVKFRQILIIIGQIILKPLNYMEVGLNIRSENKFLMMNSIPIIAIPKLIWMCVGLLIWWSTFLFSISN